MTAVPGAMQCPNCGEPVLPTDNFCEACRAELHAPAAAAQPAESSAQPAEGSAQSAEGAAAQSRAPAAQHAAPGSACPHCPGAAISADGYCESCGRRAPTARDHAESDLGWLAGVTDRGHRHYRNEDAMAVAVADAAAGPVAVAVVCDGVSGSDRGDEASQAATDAALAVLLPAARAGEDATEASTRAVQAAQAAVAALSPGTGSEAPHDSPSATFVSAVVTSGVVTVCWLGDSRAYWLDGGPEPAAQQLTADDSVAAELVAAGALTADEAAASPQAHVVTGWLGAELSGTSPHLARFVPPASGAVLLCSDGLWNYLTDADDLARRAPSPQADPIGTARRLVDYALAAGGADNVTVVVAALPPAGAERASQPARTPTEPIARSTDD